MNCTKVKEVLHEFHDGATSAAMKKQIENHFAGCQSCADSFNRLQLLRSILQKDAAPIASPTLEEKLRRAFIEKHYPPAKVSAWQRFLSGSLNIPKPIFAASLVTVVFALTAANLAGRYAAVEFASESDSTAAQSDYLLSPPQVIQTTKIVEVPVIKERVVTKIVYVERKNDKIQKEQQTSPAFNFRQTNAVIKSTDDKENSGAPNIRMSASVAENGYFMRTDLSDFEPAKNSNIRIIRKEKADEK